MALLDGVGLWCDFGGGNYAGRPALFLDRDGVIIVDLNYLGRSKDMRMLEGAAAAIARCNRLGIPVVVVSNQSGVARGYYGWSDFSDVQGALVAALAAEGAQIDAVLACAYHRDGLGCYGVDNHHWRKPNPGMILAAAEHMALDLEKSWIIGDRSTDLAAGRAAGLRGGVLVDGDADKSGRTAALALADERYNVHTAATLEDAVALPIRCILPV